MLIDLKINPKKSFQFVRLITNIVSKETRRKIEPQLKRIKKSAKMTMPSPKEIRNASMKSNIKIQSKMTPQDRFIDIIV